VLSIIDERTEELINGVEEILVGSGETVHEHETETPTTASDA